MSREVLEYTFQMSRECTLERVHASDAKRSPRVHVTGVKRSPWVHATGLRRSPRVHATGVKRSPCVHVPGVKRSHRVHATGVQRSPRLHASDVKGSILDDPDVKRSPHFNWRNCWMWRAKLLIMFSHSSRVITWIFSVMTAVNASMLQGLPR